MNRRVDVVAFASGGAVISWAERTPGGTEVRARIVKPDGSTDPPIVVAEASIGDPRMKMSGDEVVIGEMCTDTNGYSFLTSIEMHKSGNFSR